MFKLSAYTTISGRHQIYSSFLYMAVLSAWRYFPRGENAMKHIDSIEIGCRIREFRQKKGFSQERLAELLNLSPQQMQKYETGASKLNTDKRQQLAEALEITVFAFFQGYVDMPYTLTPDEKKLIEAYRAINVQEVKNGFLTCIIHSANPPEG
jgi:transcriptional regulator with XRE-family HTH domain